MVIFLHTDQSCKQKGIYSPTEQAVLFENLANLSNYTIFPNVKNKIKEGGMKPEDISEELLSYIKSQIWMDLLNIYNSDSSDYKSMMEWLESYGSN